MKFWTWFTVLPFYSSSIVTARLIPRDADFLSVRTRLDKSYNYVDSKKPDKYFHESTFHEHYDGRFADKPLPEEPRRAALRTLVQTYFLCMASLGVETWLMHGSLLGWYWNRRIMPWDTDVDVMLSRRSLTHLAQGHNMTIHKYRLPPPESAETHPDDNLDSAVDVFREFLLEINPHYRHDNVSRNNRIDARWIDTDTGLFIDITALRPNLTAQNDGVEDALMARDGHHYLFQEIYPLRRDEFEGVPVLIPFAYGDILIEEYGDKALAASSFAGHLFDQSLQEWVLGQPSRPKTQAFLQFEKFMEQNKDRRPHS